MENRLVIKQISIESNNYLSRDIRIKLYHNKIVKSSDLFQEYENNGIINWKFIFDYYKNQPIDLVFLENDIFEDDIILGSSKILTSIDVKLIDNFFFSKGVTSSIDIFKTNKKIGTVIIEQFILYKNKSKYYKCGEGWSLPDNYPTLTYFPLSKKKNIYQNIRIIKNNIEEDKSKFDLYSDAFIKIISNEYNYPPLCFGIIGPDNFGKSDLLTTFKKKLNESRNKFENVIIEFNPWSFEADDTIWASILMSIHDELENKLGKIKMKWLRLSMTFFPDKKSIIYFIIKVFVTILLISLIVFIDFDKNIISNIFITLILSVSSLFLLKDFFDFVKSGLYSISDLILNKIRKPDWSKELGFMNEIKKEFFDFINPVVKKYDYKLILLIDDLDKCSIEKIYTVIKALSLLKYSDCPIYIFLTYDSIKISEALKTYYKTRYSYSFYESKYVLNKLINIPFCLPGRDIVENLSLIDDYIDFRPTIEILKQTSKDEMKTLLSSSKKSIDFEDIIITINSKEQREIFNIQQIELNLINNQNLSLFQLENYLKYISKYERELKDMHLINKIKSIKDSINKKFIGLKKDFINNYYIGLDEDEIKLFQDIIENTKNSGNALTDSHVIKIINIYSISRFILPNYLKSKKLKLLHFIVVTENWLKIISKIYYEIKKIKFNLNFSQVKECFEDKELLFFYLNNIKNSENDEFILYLTKYELKVIEFIELEPFIFNLDRCLLP